MVLLGGLLGPAARVNEKQDGKGVTRGASQLHWSCPLEVFHRRCPLEVSTGGVPLEVLNRHGEIDMFLVDALGPE